MKYRDEKFYWTYQHGIGWPNDYIGPDSLTRWIIETSVGFTKIGLLRISQSVRAYAYLILSSQASARSPIVGNMASLTAQSAFLNNFENIVNRRVNIQEDIKRYQDTLSYASSKVDYSIGESIYMIPSDMTLKIRSGTVGYNNKILVSHEKFILGKNEKVSSLKALECYMDWFPSLICKNYIFKHFVKTVEPTSLKFCTVIELIILHLDYTIAQVNMQIFLMRMRRPLFC